MTKTNFEIRNRSDRLEVRRESENGITTLTVAGAGYAQIELTDRQVADLVVQLMSLPNSAITSRRVPLDPNGALLDRLIDESDANRLRHLN